MIPMLTTDSSTWRVLAIDDRPDNLKLIMTLLRSWNVTAASADNAEQAMILLKEFEPNLILLDLALPGLSGWEIHKIMRRLPELDNVPIIALTALARREDIARGEEAGLDGYITKPYRVDDLHNQIVTYVKAFIERHSGGS